MDGPLVAIFRYFTSCAIGCLRLDELSMPLWVSNRELDWPVCFCRFHKPRFLTINVSTHNSKSTIFWLWKAKHIKATTAQKMGMNQLAWYHPACGCSMHFYSNSNCSSSAFYFWYWETMVRQLASSLLELLWPRREHVKKRNSNPGLCLLVNCAGIRDVVFFESVSVWITRRIRVAVRLLSGMAPDMCGMLFALRSKESFTVKRRWFSNLGVRNQTLQCC